MAEMKIMTLTGQQRYDEKIKAHLAVADEAILAAAKAHAEGLADNYDAAGTATTKVQELADGAVKANADAIAKLNSSATTEGSVAKAVADAKALVDADVDAVEAKVDKNAEDIATLQGKMDAVENKAQANTDEISGLKSRADTAEDAIDAIEEDIGNVDKLSTASKNIVDALNETLAAVGSGGTAAVVAVSAKGATEEFANVYEVTQGGVVVGTINIPKDMVVESGEVVDIDGIKNIKLTLQNVKDPLYIPVGSLVDIYIAKAEAAQVQVEINPDSREISAHIVASSITAVELADNAVVTAKIADANVTKAKLSAEVQSSLNKADVAEANAKAYTDEKNGEMDDRMKAVESALVGTGDGTVNEKIDAARQAAIDAAAADATAKANAAKEAAENHANGLNTEMNARVQALEAVDHEHANATVLNGITAEKVAAWDSAEDNAVATVNAAKSELDGKITAEATTARAAEKVNYDAIVALQEKVGDGFVEITEAEINAMFA